jgi:hypothetical protein
MDDERDITEIDVDDVWLREWAAVGVAELARYLARHAAFQQYLGEREA